MAGRKWDGYMLFLAGVFAAAWAWAAYRPVFPDDWLLENYLVFFFVPAIVLAGFYFRLSTLSYTLITLFLVLHVIGSHYTYAEVPFGFTLQRWLGGSRNLYDRLVHCSFGLLLAYPVREVFLRISRVRGFWGYYLPIELTLAFSAVYELLEWAAAEFVNPAAGLAFLGAQGDIWDAQKDMAMAGLGAVVAMIVALLVTLVVDSDAAKELKESFRIPADDRPIGETQVLEWLRRRKGAR